jgi:hypothetical protein
MGTVWPIDSNPQSYSRGGGWDYKGKPRSSVWGTWPSAGLGYWCHISEVGMSYLTEVCSFLAVRDVGDGGRSFLEKIDY